MGLLDALLGNDQGGGLLGGLPSSWQYQNPQDELTKKQQQSILYDALGNVTGQSHPQDPFGAIPPAAAPPQPPSVFASGTAGLAGNGPGGPIPGMFAPQMPQQAPALPAPQTVQPAPQAPAPQDMPTNTVNVGGYQMPQFGSPQQAAQAPSTDISAQSRQSPAAQTQQPSFLSPSSSGGFKEAMRGAGMNMAGGPIGMLMGGIAGAGGMLDPNPRDVQNQNLRAQFSAIQQTLIDNGDSPQKAASKAMIAVMNPEAAKTILPELFTNKEQFKTIKDGFGGEHPAFVNELAQTINGKSIDDYNQSNGAAQGGQQAYDAIAKARDAGATHEQLYQMAPASLRDGVKAMIEGRALPASLSGRGEARNATLQLAHTIDPTFDESQISSRVQGNKDFYGGGKSAETMRKTNQSALHFGELVDKMQTLPGGPVPAANAVGNFVNSELLGKDAKGNFMVNGHALADELSSMFKGAGISDTEIRAWESNLSPDMSAQQQRGMAKTLLGLYRDSVSALEKKRQESIGPVVAAQKGPILGPEAEAALSKVEDFANGKQAAPAIPRSAIEAEMRRRGLMK